MAPDLPSELFREIINCLSKAKDLRTLQAAALVCSAFREPCQEEIFSEINVYKQRLYEDNTNHHLAGLEILRQNGTLLSYIKVVSVKQAEGGPIFLDKEPTRSCMPELIQPIATASIQKFTFVGWEGQTTPEFPRSIIACVRSPYLTSLSLTFAPGKLLSMVESPHIRHLTVKLGHSYMFRPPATRKRLFLEAFTPAPPAQTMRFPAVTITPDMPTIHFLTQGSTTVDLSTVKELKLDSCQDSRGDVSLLIRSCAPSLRKLRIVAD
ncbi:hypothetical protein BKA70DRAFT_1565608 [Coprinopsis sp. MPI-PUGE-AT-0042]|nr:hypothetical protein BKA70DRAFT_1565608 [Coprinopsis sp. MPI-PUGE-AT-0042]